MKVLIYVNTSAEVGNVDHLKVFANEEAMEKWFEENDPEGVARIYTSWSECGLLTGSVVQPLRSQSARTLRA